MRYGALEREQLLGTNLEQAWNHFSDPRNLASIAPVQPGLRIHDPERVHRMHEGRIFHYTVSPFGGVPLRWTTRIGRVHPPILFEGIQLKGPYAHWCHTHTFEAVPGGVLMKDRVEYALPLGGIGRSLMGRRVARELDAIFEHRCRVLQERFPHPRP